ncbi:GAF domain-containing protein [Actinoplanes bogorensis]|uniref:GAF domain-containing protein n=1 Tax=Paractinoplanes bogorensis TaxID=1610840 RepID=A0ABS5YN92_9ACTN|nr:GAF domain-containing protein [Actinoplanes bogorensis]MBU2664932.1 GAF domain-containing protein [Actinoplanes bogorensis]
MGDFGAVRPGTDLSRHARELRRVHDAVLAGDRPPQRPRDLVSRSWARMLGLGLDPSRANARDPLPFDEIERLRRESPLALVIDDLLRLADGFLLVVTDADGVILWRAGPVALRRRADVLGFGEGANWTETAVGTNAIGTALVEAAPVQLFSAEHFEEAQHAWYCTAHPVHDPRTGELLGIVDVSGPALTLHPAIEAMVAMGVRLAEAQLWRHHADRLERLRRSAAHVVSTVPGPLLIVDEHGWVAAASGVATRDRIGTPREGTALGVPGLGLCLPERLPEGWLVRPAGPQTAIRATLDLRSSPVLEVCGESAPWRTPLTRRHAEILELLVACGPAGLTAAQMSRFLHGDADHVVTVRAEVSRLRRAIGALVATNPYRLAAGVSLEIVGAR